MDPTRETVAEAASRVAAFCSVRDDIVRGGDGTSIGRISTVSEMLRASVDTIPTMGENYSHSV